MRPPPGRRSPVFWICATATLAAAVMAVVVYARSYFFLYDDFSLVGEAANRGLATLATSALAGFYRPLPFLFLREQFALFGWTPALYSAVALVGHLLNAVLVGVLARRLGIQTGPALVAALLFALSASATESYFWVSGVFDRLCVTGVLAALLAGQACVAAKDRGPAIGWAGLGLVWSALALLSKESAVALPALVLATLVVARNRDGGRIGAYVALVTVAVAVYFLWRQQILPGMSGAYGDWRTLTGKSDWPRNAASYAVALVRLPLPGAEASSLVRYVCIAVPYMLVISGLFACALLARRRPLLLAGSLVAIAASLVPVIWAAAAPGTSASGRFLYLPGIWVALMLAAALDSEMSAASRSRPILLGIASAVSITVLCQTASVLHQAHIWRAASRLSRETIEWMRPHRTLDRSLFIANFPAVFLEGPYVLKDYAFGYYFGPGFRPRIRVRRMTLRLVGDRAWFAGWMDYDAAAPGEHTVTLPLPIEQPTPNPQTAVQTPDAGAHVRQPFVLSGWSVDPAGPFACGVDAVHVYASAGDTPLRFIGPAALGSASPSVAPRLGARYASCGWSLKVDGLPEGSYVFTVHPRDIVLGDFTAATRVPITIEPGAQPR
jgi:hypothetical protein